MNQLYFLDIDIKGEEQKGLEMAQFIRQHNPYFFSPHKSYLSNISNISGYDKKTKDVLYYDGHRSPISRLRVRYLKEILKAKSKKEENKK